MRYIGIDLAWGAKNTTAAVTLSATDGGLVYLAHNDTLTDNWSIADFVALCDDGGGLVIAVDAPTVVPNAFGRRACEAVLARCMCRYEAGPHPANRTLLADASGEIRGEALVALLGGRFGIAHTPYPPEPPPRVVFEAFPHPAHIALFGLAKTLKYKKKPGRDRAFRDGEFRRYGAYLRGLDAAEPPLKLTPEAAPWLWKEPEDFLSEVALKRHEDLLDALTCAYIAAYHHRWAGDRSVVVGDLSEGYIVTPATPEMRSCFGALVNTAESAYNEGQERNG